MIDTSSILSDNYNLILSETDRLARIIQAVPPKMAVAAAVAPLLKGDTVHPSADIPLQPVSGREAVLLAARSYKDMHIHPDYCQQTARRTIGVLVYSPAQSVLLDEVPLIVERINAAKSNIEQYITQTFPTRGERFEALRDSCPGVMTMHLYRHIRCITSGEVRAVRFSWLRKDRLQMPDKNELMRRISVERERASEDYALALQLLLARIADTPEAMLRVRRPVPVQPVANIKTTEGYCTLTALMPIIVIQKVKPLIKPPNSFCYLQAAKKRVRSDKRVTERLGGFCGDSIEALVKPH